MKIGQLIRLEWLKYRSNRFVWVNLILFPAILIAILLFYQKVSITTSENPGMEMLDVKKYLRFPYIWEFLGYFAGNWIGFFIGGFLGIYMMSPEIARKTARQQLISGLSRSRFVLAKLITYRILAFIFVLFYLVIAIGFGSVHSNESIGSGGLQEGLWMSLRLFLNLIFYFFLGGLIGLFFKKMATAMMVYLAYGFFLEHVLRWAIHPKLFPISWNRYYPVKVAGDLMPFPGRQLVESTGMSQGYDAYLDPKLAVVLIIFYIAALFGIMIIRVKKQDF